MTDVVLQNIGSGFNRSKINNNFDKLEAAINDEVLHLEGGNNTMRQGIDANSQRILNLPDALTEQEPATLDQLNKALASVEGAEGVLPLVQPRQVGDGVATVFASPVTGQTGANDNGFFIALDGVTQRPLSDFSVSAFDGNITFEEAPAAGVLVDITYFKPKTLEPAVADEDSTVIAAGSTTARTLSSRFADVVHVSNFGAVEDGVADDSDAIASAILFQANRGGGKVLIQGRCRTTAPVVVNGKGVELIGAMPESVFSAAIPATKAGVILSDFNTGPGVLLSDSGCGLRDMTVLGTAARRAATITTGAQNTNCAVLVETADIVGDIIQSVRVENVHGVTHPGGGLLVEGDITNLIVDNCYWNDVGRHGIGVSSGEIGGRTNLATPGIVTVHHGKAFDCDGHGIAIGAPTSVQFPYRIRIIDFEDYRTGLVPAQRYGNGANWIVAQNSLVENCALGGTRTGNIPSIPALVLGGRDVVIRGCRYISCAGAAYVEIIQQAGFSTENVEINGGTTSTAGFTPPADFATVTNGVDGVRIVRMNHDGANRVDTIAVTSNSNNVELHDLDSNRTVMHNHTIDYTSSVVTGISAGGTSRTISGGDITVDKPGYYIVDTEAGAATDDLDNILGGQAGWVIYVRQNNSGRDITVRRGVGNLRLSGGSNVTFPDSANQFLHLMHNGTNWYQMSTLITNG